MKNTAINWRPEVLENDLLKLVPLNESDFETLYEAASDPLIWEQHPVSDRYKREVFRHFFDGAVAGNTAFLIIDKASGQVIGSSRYYDYKQDEGSIAVGYTFFARAYWGGRYNPSSKKLLLDYAFQFLDKVFFHIGVTNIRSQTAIKRLGAVQVNTVELDINGQKLSHFEYLLEKQHWLETQNNN